jgi:predicted transcriptional regulator
MSAAPHTSIHFQLPSELHGRLQATAHRQGRSASEVIRRALQRVLDEELGPAAGAAAAALGALPADSAMPPSAAAAASGTQQ